nr:MAG TPA: hypothetical protein [Crassvirales sp.]
MSKLCMVSASLLDLNLITPLTFSLRAVDFDSLFLVLVAIN